MASPKKYALCCREGPQAVTLCVSPLSFEFDVFSLSLSVSVSLSLLLAAWQASPSAFSVRASAGDVVKGGKASARSLAKGRPREAALQPRGKWPGRQKKASEKIFGMALICSDRDSYNELRHTKLPIQVQA